jgi:cell division protein ZapA (FtsZ GTPase activity inhibitor)
MSVTKPPNLSAEPVTVNIFNQIYHLRSDGDVEYVKELARLVNERMQAISAHTSIMDYAKVAVLAALNIADELQRMRMEAERADARGAVNGPTESSEEKPLTTTGQESAGDSWSYSDIFESPSSRETSMRMGTDLTSRLRQMRTETDVISKNEPDK